jgi:phasin
MTVRHCCSVVAHQLLIYKGIASSERVRRQILSACEPQILGKCAGHDQDPLEIPAEIRDLTAKSVEEASKAFGSFIEAAHKATAQAEGTASALQSTAKDVSAKALSFTEANLKSAFDHAQKLIQAKDPQEILAHQSEYVKKQLAAMEEHAKELGSAVLKAVTPDTASRSARPF